MNTIELNALKKEFVKEFMNEKDEVMVRRFIALFRKSKGEAGKPPCQMTIEELKAEILEAEKDYENGNYITQEDMRKNFHKWQQLNQPLKVSVKLTVH